MAGSQKMSVLARMRLTMNKETAAMTPEEKQEAVATMAHIQEARFNLIDKIRDGSPSYGEPEPQPQPQAPQAPVAVAPTDAAVFDDGVGDVVNDAIDDEEGAEEDDVDDDDDDDDEEEEEDDDDDVVDECDDEEDSSGTSVPLEFTHYFKGIELEWLSPDDYHATYVQPTTAAATDHVIDAQNMHNARVRLLRAFTTKYDPRNDNALIKRLKRAKHCHRAAPLTLRFDNDAVDDVYVADSAHSEAVVHAFFFLKNFRSIAHAHLQRYCDDSFRKTYIVDYELYLKKDGKDAANAFFFSKFEREGGLFFLYVRYQQCVELLGASIGASRATR